MSTPRARPEGGPFRRKDVSLSPMGTTFGETLAGLSGEDAENGTVHGGVQVAGIVLDSRPFKRVYQPGHPDADAQGYVSMPNIDTVTEMVDMMGATRAYEANVAAVGAVKGMAMKAMEIGRA